MLGGNLMLTIWLWSCIGMIIATIIILKMFYVEGFTEDEGDYTKY